MSVLIWRYFVNIVLILHRNRKRDIEASLLFKIAFRLTGDPGKPLTTSAAVQPNVLNCTVWTRNNNDSVCFAYRLYSHGVQ